MNRDVVNTAARSLAVLVLAAVLTPSAGRAAWKNPPLLGAWHVAASAGYVSLDDSRGRRPEGSYLAQFDPGYDVGVEGGREVFGFRLGLEASYQTNEVKALLAARPGEAPGGHQRSLSLLGKVASDLPIGPFEIFVGIGFGVSRVTLSQFSFDSPVIDDANTVLAYASEFGLGYRVGHEVRISVAFREFATEHVEVRDYLDNVFKAENSSNGVQLAMLMRW